jgi:RND family efflux transporter MFP subunit
MTHPCQFMRNRIRLGAAALTALLALLAAGCSEAPKPPPPPPPPMVTVAHPVKQEIVDRDEYVGRFVPVHSVEVRARVSGYLESVHFVDGQIVKEGDLLFTIDKRPFQNTLDQARANLAVAKSNAAFTASDLARAQQLVRDRTVTEQIYEQRAQANRNAQASVAANEALVRQAELDLEFTELRAPITGRIGDRLVAPGNLVTGGTGGNTTLLATIVSMDPIRFEFTFDEASLLRYERLARKGKDVTGRNDRSEVRLKLIDEPNFTHVGQMEFLDNTIERATGTIRGRAQFSNSDSLFTPGMFARVQIAATAPYEALLVPDEAVGTEQARKFVLVVDSENIARQKFVTLGDVLGKMRVIRSGLDANDWVIVSGLMRARAGAKVTPKEQGTPSQAAAPQASSK